MAIHCMNPNTLGTEAENLFIVTSTKGNELIQNFASIIGSLKNNWKGSDAVTNLNDLAKVYGAVVNLIKSLQTIIVKVNNEEIIPLQKHILLSGGSCAVGRELAVDITASPEIDVTVDSVESWTSAKILEDSVVFAEIPNKFISFVNSLEEAKEILLNNWLDGANRASVVDVFNKFKNEVDVYKTSLDIVKNNLEVVARNKEQLL